MVKQTKDMAEYGDTLGAWILKKLAHRELPDAAGDPDLSTLYWNMSLWGNYNVVLMKTDLTPLKTTLV